MNRASHFVAVKPAEHILKACYREAASSNGMSQNDFVNLMRNVFENYRFDTRGLPNGRGRTAEPTVVTQRYY